MKKLLIAQSVVLFMGTLFAWFNVLKNFGRFYQFEGTIFKIKDCIIPNPVTEACFYGAIGFLVALTWSIIIYRSQNRINKQWYLFLFLVAGTLFAWFNVAKEFVAYYSVHAGPVLGCSATPITNPFLTPCFTGASLFLVAMVLAGTIYARGVKPKLI